jgi:hypothetical protein
VRFRRRVTAPSTRRSFLRPSTCVGYFRLPPRNELEQFLDLGVDEVAAFRQLFGATIA